MAQPKKILVCTDGSQCACNAIEKAVEVATAYKGQLEIFCAVIDKKAKNAEELSTSKNYDAHLALQEAEDICHKFGFDNFSTKVGVGPDVVKTILAEIGNCKCELVVLGSRGEKDIKRKLLGSVSTAVSKLSPVPVLIVK